MLCLITLIFKCPNASCNNYFLLQNRYLSPDIVFTVVVVYLCVYAHTLIELIVIYNCLRCHSKS